VAKAARALNPIRATAYSLFTFTSGFFMLFWNSSWSMWTTLPDDFDILRGARDHGCDKDKELSNIFEFEIKFRTAKK
jgi:hypothetical protein